MRHRTSSTKNGLVNMVNKQTQRCQTSLGNSHCFSFEMRAVLLLRGQRSADRVAFTEKRKNLLRSAVKWSNSISQVEATFSFSPFMRKRSTVYLGGL